MISRFHFRGEDRHSGDEIGFLKKVDVVFRGDVPNPHQPRELCVIQPGSDAGGQHFDQRVYLGVLAEIGQCGDVDVDIRTDNIFQDAALVRFVRFQHDFRETAEADELVIMRAHPFVFGVPKSRFSEIALQKRHALEGEKLAEVQREDFKQRFSARQGFGEEIFEVVGTGTGDDELDAIVIVEVFQNARRLPGYSLISSRATNISSLRRSPRCSKAKKILS